MAQNQFATIYLNSGEEILAYKGRGGDKAEATIRNKSKGNWFGSLGLNLEKVNYFSKNGDLEKIKVDDIKKIVINTKDHSNIGTYTTGGFKAQAKINTESMTLLPIPIRKNRNRMMQVIAENDKYRLLNFFSNEIHYFYIYDKEGNEIEKQVIHSLTKKKNEKAMEIVKKHFADCGDLIADMDENMEKSFGHGLKQYFLLMQVESKAPFKATNYIVNYSCK